MRFTKDNRTESSAWWKNVTAKNSPFAWPHSLRIESYLMRMAAFNILAFKLSVEIPKRLGLGKVKDANKTLL